MNEVTFNGYLPCIFHRATILQNENDKLKELLSISNYLGLQADKVSIITVFLSQSGYLDRRYTEEELLNLYMDESFNCSSMRRNYDLKNLCYDCTLSNNYSNRFLNEEKQILSFSFINTTNRNNVNMLVKNRTKSLFRSYVRIGKDHSSKTYIQINLLIYNYLTTLPMVMRSKEQDEYELLIHAFTNNIVVQSVLNTLSEDEVGFVISYFLSIHNDADKINLSLEDITKLCNTLIMEPKRNSNSIKKNKTDRQPYISPLEKAQLTLDNFVEEGPTSESITDSKPYQELGEESNCVNETKNIDINSTDNAYDDEIDSHINEHDKYIFNKISINSIQEYEDIITVNSNDLSTNLDYNILGNEVMAIELIQDDNDEYLLIYLAKQRLYYLLNLKNKLAIKIITFYLEDKKSVKKVTYSSLLLLSRLSKYNIKINNLFSIETIYQVCNYVNKTCAYENILGTITKCTFSNELPQLIQGMKYYNQCYNDMFNNLGEIENNLFVKETIFEIMISHTYNLDEILKFKDNSPYVCKDLVINGMRMYTFNYTNIDHIITKGKTIHAAYTSPELELNSYISAYRDICIKCITSNVFDKFKPYLIELSKENGLIFFIVDEHYNTFLSLLNRWLINSGKKYITNYPTIEIETISY